MWWRRSHYGVKIKSTTSTHNWASEISSSKYHKAHTQVTKPKIPCNSTMSADVPMELNSTEMDFMFFSIKIFFLWKKSRLSRKNAEKAVDWRQSNDVWRKHVRRKKIGPVHKNIERNFHIIEWEPNEAQSFFMYELNIVSDVHSEHIVSSIQMSYMINAKVE